MNIINDVYYGYGEMSDMTNLERTADATTQMTRSAYLRVQCIWRICIVAFCSDVLTIKEYKILSRY